MAVRIYLEIGHEASLRTKKTLEGFTHDWEVFVRGCDGAEIQHFVEKVVFYLHETFPKPKRVIKEPPYIVKESGYAGFTLPIDIYLRNNGDPKKIRFNYDLNLQQTGPPILKAQKEKYVFGMVTDEFKMKLLKGGATFGGTTSQESSDNRSNLEDKNQLTNKPKLTGCDLIKKPKMKPGEPCRDFQELFGSPITMSSKMQEPKPPSTKNENKPRTKHSPHKDTHKDKKEEKKTKDEKKIKDKSKDRERSKDKSLKKEKSPRPKSPSPPEKKSPSRFSSPPIKHKDSKHDRERKEEKKPKKERRKEHKTDESKEHKSSEIKKEGKTPKIDNVDKKEKIKEPKPSNKDDKSHSEKYKHKKKDKEKKDKREDKYKSEKKVEAVKTSSLFVNKVEVPASLPPPSAPPKKDKFVANIDEESSNSSTSSSGSEKVKIEVAKIKEEKNAKVRKDKAGYQENAIKCKRKSDTLEMEEPPVKVKKEIAANSDAEIEKKPALGTPTKAEEDYFGLLRNLQHKINSLKDNSDLQKVVALIAETGRYEVSQHTFDFDLCLLDRSTVQQLQDFFASDT